MKKITIYSTPTCPYCVMAKDFFKEKNIEYVDVDIARDRQKAQEIVQKTGQLGVPVIIIGDNANKGEKEEIIIGFDQSKIEKILNI